MAPLERQNTLLQRFARSNEQRHALQIALYNTSFTLLAAVCVLALLALYNMLYVFLAPMMWAVLVGTLLFPAKRKVTQATNGPSHLPQSGYSEHMLEMELERIICGEEWLTSLEEGRTPLAVGVVLAPYRVFASFSETVYATATGDHGITLLVAYILLKVLSIDSNFLYVISWFGRLYSIFHSAISFFSRPWVFPVMILYFLGYAAWVWVQPREAINKKLARSFSLPIWVYVLCLVSSLFGPLQVIVFGGSAVALALLSAGVLKPAADDDRASPVSTAEEALDEKERLLAEAKKSLTATEEVVESNAKAETVVISPSATSQSSPSFGGNDLIWWTFYLVALLWVVRHDSALILVLFPLLFAILTKFGESSGFYEWCQSHVRSTWMNVKPSINKIVDVTIAGPLRQFVKMMFTSDQFLLSTLRSRMDLLSSVIVMALLAIGTLSATIFIVIQLHSETVHLIRLSSSVMSSRPEWLSSALDYTEDRLEEQNIDIDGYVDQAFQQGRAWLAANVRSLADPKDPERADQLEKHVKEIVDNIYKMWEQRESSYVASEGEEAVSGRTEGLGLWHQLRAVTDIHALKEELTHLVKNNVDTIVGVAHSLWAVLVVNLSILSSAVFAFSSLIFSFGMEMLNFFVEITVFLTMVYYLLASSSERWLPLEWLSRLGTLVPAPAPPAESPNGGDSTALSHPSHSAHGFTSAIEDAIFGVFGLSFKMALFYGLYTYFIHSLFDLNIVFVPSMLAAVFAAIPIVPAQSVCIFGLVELLLVRGEVAAGILFGVLSVAPLAVVDTKFYSEVKGMHPYVTGMSVLGGMYWLGLQGAIIGPLILCSFLVLLNIYTQLATS